jgi:hypothetical protein
VIKNGGSPWVKSFVEEDGITALFESLEVRSYDRHEEMEDVD